ncbi:putative RING-H2 finger protein ATL69 [Vigna unguiculata]|uniref:E3 ubiquitin-protein ligase n=1 Tax=Vigna unguiculata TaxID=3917 RepID=A0A4D6M2J7_VIGUN|nr:putative RING-H2 finger protein ATL69 [Vigna unguiculata]QCD95519.1 E3 ubiquitin-protein ligase [Vigna unguiculata]
MFAASPPPSAAVTTAGVGLGYGIAIAVSILVLISSIMLASYACVRFKSNSPRTRNNTHYDQTEQNHNIHDSGGPEPVVLGLEKPAIEAYPKIVVGESGRLPRPNDSGSCAICLCDYLPKDTVRCVPSCHHCFHADCVDAWLKMSATCPLCRNSPVPSPSPSPSPTPMLELVPLAFHAR